MIAAETTNEEIVFPFRNRITTIECHATGRKYGIPIVDRLFQAFFLSNAIANFGSAIFNTVSDHRPSVIFTRFNPVEFIPAAGTKFIFPQISCYRMESESLNIAVSV